MSEVVTGPAKTVGDLLAMKKRLAELFDEKSHGCRFAYDKNVPCGTYSAELVGKTVYVGLCACSMSYLFLAADTWQRDHDGEMPEGMRVVSLARDN